MNRYEVGCVVCGEPTSALFCDECERLLRMSPFKTTAFEPWRPVAAGVETDD